MRYSLMKYCHQIFYPRLTPQSVKGALVIYRLHGHGLHKSSDLWHGHVVKSIDGSSVLLMDTEANQLKYPQPSSQKTGCGFPAMGVVALLNHSHGGWEGFETCDARMRDTRVAPRMLKHMDEGDVLLADRAFCSYEFCAQLMEKGAYFVMRLHQARHCKLDW